MSVEPSRGPAHQDQSPLLVAVDPGGEKHVRRITVAGEMDAVSAPALREAVSDMLRQQRPGRIEIGLRGVTFLDSAGIRSLLLCHSDARGADCQLRLTDPHPRVRRVLQITGLLDHFGLAGAP
jgi:anti-anti-sigma factor